MLIDQANKAIAQYDMIPPGCRVVAAVSGGADSTALLHFLHALQQERPFFLSAAHFHHGIRGEEADRDEDFVRQLCLRWDLPLQVGRADVPALCRESGEGLEECARRVRYAFLADCAQGGRIATAHTMTDNVETFFIRLLRGSGLKGLGGIPPVRGNILRPLIFCSRADVEEYCAEQGLDYVTDSTNLTDDCLRNRVRHRLLPVLSQLEEGAEETLSRTMIQLRQDEECLSRQAEQTAVSAAVPEEGLSASELLSLPDALRARVLLRFAGQCSAGRMDAKHVEMLNRLLVQGGAAVLPGGVRVACRDGRLYRDPFETAPSQPDWEAPLSLGICDLPNGRYRFTLVSRGDVFLENGPDGSGRFLPGQNEKIYNLLLYPCIDYDKIRGKVALRTRRPGDAMTLPRRPRKSLKKLWNESAVPARERASRLVLADEEGVIFAEGFGPDQRCAPDDATKRILRIEKLEEFHAS